MAFSANKHEEPAPQPDRVLSLVQSSLEDDKAEDTVVIPLAEKSDIADYLVIASVHQSTAREKSPSYYEIDK